MNALQQALHDAGYKVTSDLNTERRELNAYAKQLRSLYGNTPRRKLSRGTGGGMAHAVDHATWK